MKRFLLILSMVALLIVGCNANEDSPTPTVIPTVTQAPDSSSTPSPMVPATPVPSPADTLTPSPDTTVPPSGTLPEQQVHFIDVGQGDAILCDLGEADVMIDVGGRFPGVVNYLQGYIDGPLEVMVATHPSC